MDYFPLRLLELETHPLKRPKTPEEKDLERTAKKLLKRYWKLCNEALDLAAAASLSHYRDLEKWRRKNEILGN